jgi:hypothetical protein
VRRALNLLAALTFAAGLAASAQAAPALDAKGKCRDSGKFVAASLCKPPAKPAKCRDAKGKFVKCDAPGAKPAK